MMPSMRGCDENLEVTQQNEIGGQHYRTIRNQSGSRAGDNESALSESSGRQIIFVPENSANNKMSPH